MSTRKLRTSSPTNSKKIGKERLATFPGYFGIVPSGGFELYELENNQSESVIEENYAVIGTLFREYIEELFGDVEFEFLGVAFDLTTLRQTLSFVLRIDDIDFFFNNEIKKNEENKYIKFESLKKFVSGNQK